MAELQCGEGQMLNETNRRFLTAKELAQRWPITEETLAQWRFHDKSNPEKRKGPRFVKLGAKPVYYLDDIDTYEKENRI